MAKRGQGEGSISKRPDGTWWARITVGKTPDGKQKRKAFYGKTRKEVQEKLTAALNDINNNTYIEPSKMTVEQWMYIWLKEYKIHSIKPKTYVNYETYIRCHIVPVIGKYPLKSLRNDIVQKFVNTLQEKELKASTVIEIYGALRVALDQAVENSLLPKNPANNIKLPRKVKEEARALTVEEQKKFLEEAKQCTHGEMFILILYTGMRLGEAAALTWDDIDFERKVLSISKTQTRYIVDDGGNIKYKIGIGETKTIKSVRKIPLIPSALELLAEVRTKQDKIKQERAAYYIDNNLVFCTSLGKMIDRRDMQKRFNRIANSAGIVGAHPHTLRHTFATRGLENGIDLKIMQDILGHASIKMTADTYTHVLPDVKAASMMKLSGVM